MRNPEIPSPHTTLASIHKQAATLEASDQWGLIKAAPALLEACKIALEFIRNNYPMEHGNPDLGKAWSALQSALEATGEEF